MTFPRLSRMTTRGLLSGQLCRPELQTTRPFYAIFYAVINRMDRSRVKEVGRERACAEWLLRCGASIRWRDSNSFFTDYNMLPPGRKFGKLVIEEVNADDASIMAMGFEHLIGLKHIRKMRFHHCAYFDDNCCHQLENVKDSLQHLEISDCDVSDSGVPFLCNLKQLKTLRLIKLEEIRNPEKAVSDLKESLPDCDVSYKHEEPEA